MFHVLSRAVDDTGGQQGRPSVAQAPKVTDVGEGILEGVGVFGSSILKGFKGLVEKPVQGAKQAGVEGGILYPCFHILILSALLSSAPIFAFVILVTFTV